MQVQHERCCGLDIHKRMVVACARTPSGQQTRTFSTTTVGLRELGAWLAHEGVTQVAMESTGVYWQPVFNVLEEFDVELLVVNARQVKQIPGRKTDVKDAEWLADLLRHGLVRGSAIPDRARRELRELVRYRVGLLRQRTQVVQRIQKLLEGANIKLSSVVSDITGVTGRAILDALAAGKNDPTALAELAKGSLVRKHAQLHAALQGSIGPHQRLVLGSHLRHLDFLATELTRLNTEVAERLQQHEALIERLDEIPGVGRRVAEMVLAELGSDVSRFPTAGHLASWTGLCPGNHESAGKRLSGRTRKGDPWLREVLVEAAWGAAHSRGSYLGAQYRRLAARRGAKRAIVAVAHSLLVIIYHLLRDGTFYADLGANYFDERDRDATVRRSVRRIERLGFRVTVEAAA
jgi:transposase